MDAKEQRIAELEAENAALRETIQGLMRTIAALEDKIARLEKNSNNSSKPPSSDIIKPTDVNVRGKKRKRGGQAGHAKHQRAWFPEDQVDKAFDYELTAKDAVGLRALPDWHIVQQVELTDRPFVVTEHRARRYVDRTTGRIVIAPLPPEVINGGLLGSKLSALIAYQKSACHMSYSTIQRFLSDVFGLDLSRGCLAKVVQKASEALATPYDHARESLGPSLARHYRSVVWPRNWNRRSFEQQWLQGD